MTETPLVTVEGDEPILFRRLWDRQREESQEEYSLFKAYRDMGATRRIDSMAIVVGREPDYLRGLAYRLKWESRVNGYDQHIESILSKYYTKLIDSERKESAKILLEIMRRDIGLLMNKVTFEDNDEVSPDQLVKRMLGMAKIFEFLNKHGEGVDDDGKNRSVSINFVTPDVRMQILESDKPDLEAIKSLGAAGEKEVRNE